MAYGLGAAVGADGVADGAGVAGAGVADVDGVGGSEDVADVDGVGGSEDVVDVDGVGGSGDVAEVAETAGAVYAYGDDDWRPHNAVVCVCHQDCIAAAHSVVPRSPRSRAPKTCSSSSAHQALMRAAVAEVADDNFLGPLH